ncbi:MAG: hypothetical protein ACLFTS_02060, partial [Candidatus Paceibacterota bacterium]
MFCYTNPMEENDRDDSLADVHELVRENNKMLRQMRDAQRRAGFFKILYWVIIVGVALIAYLYIEPYLDDLEALYTEAQNASARASEAFEE